jgi:1-acyl-sn-glycerol-3-phosphate acyltransferase
MIRALFVTSLTLAFLVLVGPPVLIYTVVTGSSDALYRIGVWACGMVVRLSGARLEVEGREKIPSDRAVVFMPNHQGNCDPPALLTLLPPVLVMAKKEFFRIPILGQAMRLRRFIPVDRQNREQAIQAVNNAVKAVRAGQSFLIFPEGTRSRDGRLQPLKKGAFVLAMTAGAPIVPISVSGSSKIMRKGEFGIHPGRVRVVIHDPISTEGCTLEDRERLMEEVRQAILTGLAEDERPLQT